MLTYIARKIYFRDIIEQDTGSIKDQRSAFDSTIDDTRWHLLPRVALYSGVGIGRRGCRVSRTKAAHFIAVFTPRCLKPLTCRGVFGCGLENSCGVTSFHCETIRSTPSEHECLREESSIDSSSSSRRFACTIEPVDRQ